MWKMEKGQKLIILASTVIIGITAIAIAALSPGAFDEQCKQKAKEILDNLYSIEGGKEEFLRSNSQGLLSSAGQEGLQNLENVQSQCPVLKSTPEDELGAADDSAIRVG
jgi:hypothetical protein